MGNKVEDEGEEGEDIDDPFAMMAGMGEEEVYRVTLMEENADDKEAKVEKETPPEDNKVEEEGEEGEDIDDPFAMMAGMGEEEVYKVTLMEEDAGDTEEKVEKETPP